MRFLFYLMLGAALCAPGLRDAKAAEVQPRIVLASLQPVSGCNDPATPWMKSGCLDVPKPMDQFYVPCGDGYECPITYKAKHTSWGRVQTLPPVTVVKPMLRRKGRHIRNASVSNTNAAVPGPSAGAQIAAQIARQGTVMGSQFAGAMAGSALGGPIGGLVGGWLGCTFSVYGFVQNDFAKTERWDLHPELAQANFTHSLIGCSLIGFLQRAKEAPTERERAFALLQGLALIPHPYISLVGQLAPAANAILPRGTAAAQSGTFLGLWVPSKPYHDEPWIANTPG